MRSAFRAAFPVLVAAALGCAGTPAGPPPSGEAVVAQVGVAKTPHGIDAAKGFVYVGSIEGEAISVIDAATDALVKTLPRPGGRVVYVLPFPDGNHVAALDNKTGEVLVIDPAADHRVLQAVPVGKGPDEARFLADGSLVVALADEDALVRLTFEADRTKPPARRTYPVGTAAGATNRHRPLGAMAGWAVVPNTGDNHATITDLATGARREVMDGNNPGPVAIAGQDGVARVAIVGWRASHRLTIHDLAGGEPVRIDGQGQFPQAIAVDEGLRRAFVVMSGSDELLAVDYERKAAVGRVKVGSRPVELHVWPGHADPAAKEIWVGNDGGGSVTVLDAATLRTKATLAVGQGHHHLATTNGKVYVSNLDSGTVTVIDRARVR